LTQNASMKTKREQEISERELEIKRRIEDKLKQVRRVVLVMSGKGGVGKSTVTANLAATLASKKGNSVGILDSDFHGPVIPIMLGVQGMRLKPMAREGVCPVEGPLGIKLASLAFYIPHERIPFTLRGVLKYEVLRELLGQVIWGELDYLLVDLPPGTSDDSLNVAFAFPKIDGAILVTIPTEVSRVPVRKCAVFCKQYKIKMLGVVENMSSLNCPHCGKEIEIFGSGGKAERIAKDEGVPFLGRIPFDPRLATCMDEGQPFVLKYPHAQATRAFEEIAAKIISSLS